MCEYISFFLSPVISTNIWNLTIILEIKVYKHIRIVQESSYFLIPFSIHILMGLCKKDITPLLMHWSYILFALTNGYTVTWSAVMACSLSGLRWITSVLAYQYQISLYAVCQDVMRWKVGPLWGKLNSFHNIATKLAVIALVKRV